MRARAWALTACGAALAFMAVAGAWLVVHRQSRPGPLERTPPRVFHGPNEAPSGTHVSGRVVALEGPVAGLRVTATGERPDSLSLALCPDREQPEKRLLSWECRSEATQRVATALLQGRGDVEQVANTTTDADGAFTLELPDGREVALWADGAGKVGVLLHVHRGEGRLEIPVSSGVTLRGRVTVDGHMPLQGAAVTAVFPEHSRLATTTSGPDGAFALPGLPTGEYFVVATQANHAPASQSVFAGIEPTLVLPPLKDVEVRVDDGDEPVSGATVRLDGEPDVATALTRKDGVAKFEGLAAHGWLRIIATKDERVGRASCELAREGACAVHLGPGVALDVDCLDDSGKPVEGASIEAEAYRGGTWQTISDAVGHARLGPLVQDDLSVKGTAVGLTPTGFEVPHAAPGDAVPVHLTFHAASTLAGRVVDADGKAVGGASLGAFPTSSTQVQTSNEARCRLACAYGHATSGADGLFSVGGLDTGPYSLNVSADGYQEQSLGLVPPRADVVVTLKRGAVVKGRVVDADGAPVEQARVRLESPSRDEHHSYGCQTGTLGLFELKGAPAGTFRVIASTVIPIATSDTGPFANRLKESTVVVPEQGEVWLDIQFDKTFELRGRVVDGSGNPLPEVKVLAEFREGERGDGSGAAAVSTGDGTFVLTGLRDAEYELSGFKHGWKQDRSARRVRAPTSDVTIVLRPVGELKGRVVDRNHRPVTEFELDEQPIRSSDGAFSLPSYSGEKECILRIRATGFAPLDVKLETQEGGIQDLGEVVLDPGTPFQGVVKDSVTGRPISGVTVRFPYYRGDGFYICSSFENDGTVSDARGHFKLEHVQSGAKQVCFAHDAHLPKIVDVTDGSRSTEVLLDRGARVVGVVTGPDGAGVAGMAVNVEEENGAELMRFVVTDPAGKYEASGLEGGAYIVRPRPTTPNAGYAPVRVTLSDHGEGHQDFQAQAEGTTLRITLAGAAPGDDIQTHLMPGIVTDQPDGVAFYRGTATELPFDEVEGASVYKNLAPGDYTLWLTAKFIYMQHVVVGAGPEQSLELDPATATHYVPTQDAGP